LYSRLFSKRLKIKTKGKFVPVLINHHGMKTYWESGGIPPHIPDLGARDGGECQLHAPAAVPPGKEPLVHIG